MDLPNLTNLITILNLASLILMAYFNNKNKETKAIRMLVLFVVGLAVSFVVDLASILLKTAVYLGL